MNRALSVSLVAAITFSSGIASSTPGDLDAYGGHKSEFGAYHYHSGKRSFVRRTPTVNYTPVLKLTQAPVYESNNSSGYPSSDSRPSYKLTYSYRYEPTHLMTVEPLTLPPVVPTININPYKPLELPPVVPNISNNPYKPLEINNNFDW